MGQKTLWLRARAFEKNPSGQIPPWTLIVCSVLCYKMELMPGATIKDTWTKPRGGCKQGRKVGLTGVGWRGGEKMQTTVTEQ